MNKEEYIQIGEFAKICDVTVQSLHYYDRIGFLKPIYIDPETNYRYYSKNQIFFLWNTKLFQSVGFKLKEIKDILNEHSIESIVDIYHAKQKEIETQIHQLQERKKRIDCYLNYFESMLNGKCIDEKEIGKIKLKEISGLNVAFVRDKISYDYPSLMFFYNHLLTLIFEKNLKVERELLTVFHGGYIDIYHQKVDIELAMVVKSNSISDDCIRKLPYDLYVTCIHQGKYPSSLKTYQRVIRWIDVEGYKVVGPVNHVLLVPIAAARIPESTVFEIRIPVKKKELR